MDDVCLMDPGELSLVAALIAISLAKGRTSDEINVLGNFIVAVGGLLLAYAAQAEFIAAEQNKSVTPLTNTEPD